MEASAGSGVRAALAHRDFRFLLAATAVSGSGDFLYGVALVVFVFEATQSTAWVAAAVVVRTCAYFFLSPVGGAIGDRVDKRRLLMGVNAAHVVVMMGFTVVVAAHGPVLVALGFSFLSSSLSSFNFPTVFALIPSAVGEDDLAAANALFSSIEQTSVILGPAAGAIVVVAVSVPAAFALNGVTFAVATVLYWFLTRVSAAPRDEGADPSGEPASGVLADIADGWRAIRASPTAGFLLGLTFATIVVGGFELVLYVSVADELLGTGSDGVGYLMAATGVGGLLASLVGARLANTRHLGALVGVTLALSGLPMAALAILRQPAVAYVAVAIGGAAYVVFEVLTITMLQRSVAGDVLGRVFGLMMSVASAATLVGALAAPVLVSGFGLPTTLAVAGLSVGVVAVLCAPKLRRLGRAAVVQGDELAPRVAVLSSLGLFEGLPRAAIELVASAVIEEQVATGATVVREGDPSDDLFVVRSGDLGVLAPGGRVSAEAASAPIVNRMGAGDWFGEIGLLSRVPRTATVVASTECDLWRIPGEVFLEAMQGLTGLPDPVRLGMAARLARTHSWNRMRGTGAVGT